MINKYCCCTGEVGSSSSSVATESEGEPSVVVAPARAVGVTLGTRNRKEETGQKGEHADQYGFEFGRRTQ